MLSKIPDVFQIPLQGSFSLCCFILVGYLVAGIGAGLLFPFPISIVALLFLAQMSCKDFQLGLKKNPDSIICCEYLEGNKWRLINQAGEAISVRLQKNLLRSSYLVVLLFKKVGSSRTLVLAIPYDATSSENYTLLLSKLLHA